MPLADMCCRIPSRLQYFRERYLVGPKVDSCAFRYPALDSGSVRASSRQQPCSRRGAKRRRCIVVGESQAIVCQRIQIWRLENWMPEARKVTVAKIVNVDQKDIWRVGAARFTAPGDYENQAREQGASTHRLGLYSVQEKLDTHNVRHAHTQYRSAARAATALLVTVAFVDGAPDRAAGYNPSQAL